MNAQLTDTKKQKFTRAVVLVMMIATRLYNLVFGNLQKFGIYVSDFLIHVFLYRCKVGYVEFEDVEEEHADAFLWLRSDSLTRHLVALPIRFSNRWIARRHAKMSMHYLRMQIDTQANLRGLRVWRVDWSQRLHITDDVYRWNDSLSRYA